MHTDKNTALQALLVDAFSDIIADAIAPLQAEIDALKKHLNLDTEIKHRDSLVLGVID